MAELNIPRCRELLEYYRDPAGISVSEMVELTDQLEAALTEIEALRGREGSRPVGRWR